MQPTFLTRFRAWLVQGNRTTWMIFFLFVVVVDIKGLIFAEPNWYTIPFTVSFGVLAELIAATLFLSSFIFITKRHWWTVVIILLMDIDTVTHPFFYYIAKDFWSICIAKQPWSMEMVDLARVIYMNILEDAFSRIGWDFLSQVAITILYVTAFCLLRLYHPTERKYSHFIYIIVASIVLIILSPFLYAADYLFF